MKRKPFFIVAVCLWSVLLATAQDSGQKKGNSETSRHRYESLVVLDGIRNTLREHYFDRAMKGIDLDAKVRGAEERIKTLHYNWEMYRVLAQFLLDFDDSHTTFELPPRADRFSYGFEVQMIGNECLVTSVTQGSDAQKKGLAIGDRIDNIGKFVPNRADLWKIFYVLNKLSPTKEVGLKVTKPDGTTSVILVEAATRSQKQFDEEMKLRRAAGQFKPAVCKPVSPEIIACKFRSFSVDERVVTKMLKDASGYKKLILDLRGNGGGYVSTEIFMIGAFFDKEVKVAEMVTRKKSESRTSKGWGSKGFLGELTILMDSRSASAAEVFARVMQIEKRGKIYGDRSSGSVMTSIFVPLSSNAAPDVTVIGGQFGMSVTVADVIMSDGGRLENVGVIPDVPVIPTQEALAKRLDPVLALAATNMGFPLTPEAAGKYLFIGDGMDDGANDEKAENRSKRRADH